MQQPTDGPPLTPEATTHAGAISTFIHERLKVVAKQLAKSNGCEFTQKRDVNIALMAIKEAGLKAPPPPPPPIAWYHRSEFRVAAGAVTIGIAPSISGLAATLIGAFKDSPKTFAFWVIILPMSLAVGGFCFAWSGWVKNTPDQPKS